MTVYISGAMTGIKEYNTPAFNRTSLEIKAMAKRCYPQQHVRIINPAVIGKKVRRDFAKQKKGAPEWTDYMRACIKELCKADCAYFLPDWAESKGASLERHIAIRIGVLISDNIDELKLKFYAVCKTS